MGKCLDLNNNHPPVRLGQAIGALLNVKPLYLVLFKALAKVKAEVVRDPIRLVGEP